MEVQSRSITPPSIPPPPSPASAPPEASSEPKDWTVLSYLNGTNNLEPALVHNLMDMEDVGSTNSVNLVAQLSRAPQNVAHKKGPADNLDGDWTGTRRYLVSQAPNPDQPRTAITSKVLEELPASTDMGSKQTFTDFLKWGIKNFPAKHYMVVINDHGGGFRGCSWDDVHDTNLSLPDLKQSFSDAQKATGVKPDILLFDACEMQQAEVNYELKDATKYVLGSEEEIGDDGLPYNTILKDLTSNPKMTDPELATKIVDVTGQAEAARNATKKDADVQVYSAVDESKIDGVVKAADNLAVTLEKEVPRKTVASVVKLTKRFEEGGHAPPDRDYRDLGDFADRLMHSHDINNDKVTAAAQNVLDSIDHAVIDQEKEGKKMSRTHGLSIYLPTNIGKDDPAKAQPSKRENGPADPTWGYNDLDMSKDGEWAGFLGWLSGKNA